MHISRVDEAYPLPYHAIVRLTVWLVLLAGGCHEPFAPPLAVSFDPPPVFASYWSDMERCSGLRGDLARVRWYVVPAGELWLDGVRRSGVWAPPHSIYVTDVVVAHLDRYAAQVAHEILHDLERSGGHPEVFDRCGVM